MRKYIFLILFLICSVSCSFELNMSSTAVEVSAGDGFEVKLTAMDIQNLAAWEATLVFDKEAFQYLNIKFHQQLKQSQQLTNRDNLSSGRLMIGEFSWAKGSSVSGDIPLATLQFMKVGPKRGEIYISKDNFLSGDLKKIVITKKNSLTIFGVEKEKTAEETEKNTDEIADSGNTNQSDDNETQTQNETPVNNDSSQNNTGSSPTNNQTIVTNTVNVVKNPVNTNNSSIYQTINPSNKSNTSGNVSSTSSSNTNNNISVSTNQTQNVVNSANTSSSQKGTEKSDTNSTVTVSNSQTSINKAEQIAVQTEVKEVSSQQNAKIPTESNTSKKEDIPKPDARCFIDSLIH